MDKIIVVTYDNAENYKERALKIFYTTDFETAKKYVAKRFAKAWNNTGENADACFMGKGIKGFTTCDEAWLCQIEVNMETRNWSSYVYDCDTHTNIIWEVYDLSSDNDEEWEGAFAPLFLFIQITYLLLSYHRPGTQI